MNEREGARAVRGLVFNIQYYCIHDGPGIRTTVFLKGCALRCAWCSNPESINLGPELGFIKAKCSKCNKCVPACPEHAILGGANDQVPMIDRRRCTNCGKCVEACLYGALAIYGKDMTAGELFEAVRTDDIFYRRSDGGVTVSGGEPLYQAELVWALFEQCRSAGIHTAIETSGQVAPRILQRTLNLTDYVLFDLKHMDSKAHKQYTGQSNDLILANARRVAASGVPVLFRIPTIPGVNETDENIRATADFLKSLGPSHAQVELLPYHRMGLGKYEALGRPNLMEQTPPPMPAQMEEVRSTYERLGIACTISR